jgi:DNA-binding transcriptional LysR family regulator
LPTADISTERSSHDALKQAMMAGMGLGFLSRHTIALELQSGLTFVHDIEGTLVMRLCHLVRLQLRLRSPATEVLCCLRLEQGEA